jgi:chloride channel 3/4/5
MADNERSPLLAPHNRRLSKLIQQDEDASSVVKSHVTVEELKMGETAIGERLPYNDYTTIDWLHDLVCTSSSRRLREALQV